MAYKQFGALAVGVFAVLGFLFFFLKTSLAFESTVLLAVLVVVFQSAMPFVISYFASSSYLRTGLRQLLLLGCAMVAFGIFNAIVAWGILFVNTPDWANFIVTIHNTGLLTLALLTFSSSILAFYSRSDFTLTSARRKSIVFFSYLTVGIMVFLFAFISLSNVTPQFMILGEFTLLRQAVLVSTVTLLIAASLIFVRMYLESKSSLVYWYSLGLTSIGIGVIGILIESSLGTPLSWIGRAAQYAGSVFLLIAVLGRVSSSSPPYAMAEAFKRDKYHFNLLFANMGDGFAYHKIILDKNGKPVDYVFLEINDTFEKMTGLKKQQTIGRRVTEALPGIEESSFDWIGTYGKVALTMEPVKFESYFEPLQKWYAVSAFSPTRTYFATTFEDITERKKAEEELRKSQEMEYSQRKELEALMETVPATIWITHDPECSNMVGNKATYDLVGLPKSANVSETAPEEQRPVNFLAYDTQGKPIPLPDLPMQVAARTGKPVLNSEFEFRFDDGRSVWVYGNVTSLRDAQGNPQGAVGAYVDITERKNAEEALKERETLYKTLFDNSQDGFQLLESLYREDGKAIDFRYLKINNAYERMVGVKAADIEGKKAREVFPNYEQNWLEVPQRVNETGKTAHVELFTRTVNKYFDLYYFPYSRNKVGTLFRDITERKNLEKQLQDKERLAAIGATAGMVGHDIRNPLQAITGDVYLAKTELSLLPESDEKKNTIESLQEIEKNIDYINKIVQDLQDYARPLNPKAEETDLKLITTQLFEKNSWPENIELSVKVENSAKKITTDPYYINRIMYNLITNAVQAMPNGGRLTVHAFQDAKDIVMIVKDTGVGIPKDLQDKMFTLMFTTKAKGQGFGLPVVKRMAESLGGTVTFESQEGKGTTFTVRLPLNR